MLNWKKSLSLIVLALVILSSGVVFGQGSEEVLAVSTKARVLVNGEKVSFEAYTINGNNYFKLRNLAQVFTGSEKQFDVIWSEKLKAIELISNQPYTSVGGELAGADGLDKKGVLNTSKIYKDGEEVDLLAYTINNNNFFKLRDLAEIFDIGVDWDGKNQTIKVDTSKGYQVEKTLSLELNYSSGDNIEGEFDIHSLIATRVGDTVEFNLTYESSDKANLDISCPNAGDWNDWIDIKLVENGIQKGNNSTKFTLSIDEIKTILSGNSFMITTVGNEDLMGWLSYDALQLKQLLDF